MKSGFVVPLKEKISFGVGDLGINLAFTSIGFYFIFFLVNVAGLPAEYAGIIFALSKLWDAVTDYYMGVISDRTTSRFGRRRPYILLGSIPFAISFALLWFVPSDDPTVLFIYYLLVVLLFNTAFTVVSVPYNALLPELTSNYEERTTITGIRMSFSFLGTLLGAAGVTLIVDVLFKGEGDYRKSYPIMGILFALFIIVIMFITFAGTKERVKELPTQRDGPIKTLKSLLALREFKLMLGLLLFCMIAIDIFMAVILFFLQDVIEISSDFTFVLMGIPLVVAALVAPLWVYLGNKWGKREGFAFSALLFTLFLLLFLVAPKNNIPFAILIAVLAGVGISASQIFPWSIMPDINELDELKNGQRREGTLYGITIFLWKTASAIAILIVSGILGAVGYVEGAGATQSQEALLSIRIILGVIPGVCLLLAAYFALKLPLSKGQFEQIKEDLAMRKEQRSSRES